MATISKYTTKHGPRYRVRYTKPDGTHTDRRGFKLKRDAEDYAATLEVEKLTGTWIDPTAGKTTITTIAKQRLTARKATLKPSTWQVEHDDWNRDIQPRWGNRSIGSITPSEIETWIAELAARGLSASTIARLVAILRGIYHTAKRDNLIHVSPLDDVKLPKRTRKPRAYLTMNQVLTLAEACTTTEKHLLVLFLSLTGLRWGEMAALRVTDLDLLRKRVNVAQSAVKVKGQWVVTEPKTWEARSVPFPDTLTRLLARQCEGRARNMLVFGGGTTPLNRPHESGWLNGAITRARRIDETLPKVTPHELRHTAASLAIHAGANVKAVQRMLGHKSAAMTLDTYADLFETDVDGVATALDAALKLGQKLGKTSNRAHVHTS